MVTQTKSVSVDTHFLFLVLLSIRCANVKSQPYTGWGLRKREDRGARWSRRLIALAPSEIDRAVSLTVERPSKEHAVQFTWVAQEALVDVTAAYTGFSVSLPKVGLQIMQHKEASWAGTFETHVLLFAESDAGRLARAFDGGENAEIVELCWEQERPAPFRKTEGVLT